MTTNLQLANKSVILSIGAHSVFISASYNLVCVFTMIALISCTILVAMVTIWVGKYGYLTTIKHLYKIDKVWEALPIAIVLIGM